MTIALVSGALADAFDRRVLVLLSELGSAVVMAALLGNSLLDNPHVWVLFACATLLAGLYALLRPPLDSLVPRVVPREQLKAAISTPPSAGPAIIPTFPRTHSSAMAAFICSRGTTRGTSASSGGRSSA